MAATGTTADVDLAEVYRDLHAHPELVFRGNADRLRSWPCPWPGRSVSRRRPGWGRTGVVGILRNGPGPAALLRADMDALPVREETGLDYASTATRSRRRRARGAADACLRARHARDLPAGRGPPRWPLTTAAGQGTLSWSFQPAEEVGGGRAGHGGRWPVRAVGSAFRSCSASTSRRCPPGFSHAVLAPRSPRRIPCGSSCTAGAAMVPGPKTTVDPVVMAAATVMRLQGIVSREVGGDRDRRGHGRGAAGRAAKENIIPDDA